MSDSDLVFRVDSQEEYDRICRLVKLLLGFCGLATFYPTWCYHLDLRSGWISKLHDDISFYYGYLHTAFSAEEALAALIEMKPELKQQLKAPINE